jgi:hypothetical protein
MPGGIRTPLQQHALDAVAAERLWELSTAAVSV